MTNVIVVFPKLEDATGIKNLLIRNGFTVAAVCTSGAQAINIADSLNDGIVVCGYKFSDMIYSDLRDCLPATFELLLIASQSLLGSVSHNNVVCLSMPIKVHDLINTLEMISLSIAKKRKKLKAQPRHRSAEEIAIIDEAKKILIEKNNMTEEEAHRYIQKCSMDSGTNLVETAEMVIAIMLR